MTVETLFELTKVVESGKNYKYLCHFFHLLLLLLLLVLLLLLLLLLLLILNFEDNSRGRTRKLHG